MFNFDNTEQVDVKVEYYIPEAWHRLYPEWWFKDLWILEDDFHGIRTKEQSSLNPDKNTFQIYKSFQGWLYTYDVWLNIPVQWKIYFKVYDLLTNTELSSESLSRRSTMSVPSTHWKIKYFSFPDHFTVYEWDWWEYYGARFELWYVPLAPWRDWTKKLLEDYYIIDWWMR